MIVKNEINLRDFDFWGGASDRREAWTDEQLDRLETELTHEFMAEPTETELNDLFWFEQKYLCELIGEEYDEDTDTIKQEDEEDAD